MEAQERYYQARRKADQQDLIARLTRREDDLLPYDTLMQVLQAYQRIPHTRPQTIPLDRIVGSVGRYRDFTRSFLPREGIKRERWVRIDAAMNALEGLPPIEVYQVGDVYFVADGNHRVSVARANGFKEIDAYVTKIELDPHLEPGDTLDQAIIKVERTRFLAETRLDTIYPNLDIEFTRPGGYTRLLEHIRVHRNFMHMDNPDAWQITTERAAEDWYEEVYQPIIAAIRKHDLLQRFAGRTAADLYIWVSERIVELNRLYNQDVSPEEAVMMLAKETHTPFFRSVLHLLDRLAEMAGEAVGPGGIGAEWTVPPSDNLLVTEPETKTETEDA